MKGTWDVINKTIPINKKASNFNDISATNAQERADDFNEYFASTGKITFEKSQENIAYSNPLPDNQPSVLFDIRNKFRPQVVDINTLILVTKALKLTNSIGSDGIVYHCLIEFACNGILHPYHS